MSEKEKFCQKLQAAVNDENMAVAEYEALALEALRLEDRDPTEREVVSILLEKVRDDEASHRDAIKKLVLNVCPIGSV